MWHPWSGRKVNPFFMLPGKMPRQRDVKSAGVAQRRSTSFVMKMIRVRIPSPAKSTKKISS